MNGIGTIMALATLLTLAACDARQVDLSPSHATTGPSTSLAPQELLPLIAGPCCAGLPLEAGLYETPPWFTAAFTIQVGSGLSGVGSDREAMVQLGYGRSTSGSLNHYVAFFAVQDADEVLRRFLTTPKATIGDVSPWLIGELDGSRVDGSAELPKQDSPDDEIAEGAINVPAIDRLTPAFFYTESPGASIRLISIPRDSADLIVYIEAPRRDFDEFAATIEEMLGSLDFLDP